MEQRRSSTSPRPLVGLFALAVLAGCVPESPEASSPASGAGSPGFITHQRLVYSDGLHNENTEMIRLGERILLAFRGGETGQTGSARARILIFESTDGGRTFTPLSEVAMPNDSATMADDRDIRDPKLVAFGDRLLLFAISRVPGFTYRDLAGEAWTVRAESLDGGRTWTEPTKTFTDSQPSGERFWGFWRFTKRRHSVAGEVRETLYATGYDDGDVAVGLFRSEDGVRWQRHAIIFSSYDDIPSEAELHFFGGDDEKAVSLIRLDNQGSLSDGQTAICTSSDPFTDWECGRRIEQRFDGPTWVVRADGGRERSFVFARKHLPCTFKRTAAYELGGDLPTPGAPVEVCEIQELESSGDTAYTALVPLDGDRFLLSWYSSRTDEELPWLEAQFAPSDIWLADVDFGRAPDGCTPPEPERACEPPPLPPGREVFDVSGEHLLALAPVTWPSLPLLFTADVTLEGRELDLTLQPLTTTDRSPVGDAWPVAGVPFAEDGSFTASFGTRLLPAAASPSTASDEPLRLEDFSLTGKTISADGFCGVAGGVVRVLDGPTDVVLLAGSTFGAERRRPGEQAAAPSGACP